MIELLAALRRRWPLTILAAVLVIAAGLGSWSRSSPTYSYTSTVLLLPPAITSHVVAGEVDYTKGNPLFYVGSLSQTRDILIGQLTSKDLQEKFVRSYPDVSYTATGDILGSSPVVVLTTEGTSDTGVRAAIQGLTSSVATVLAQLQQQLGIKSDAVITSERLSIDQTATVSNKARIRTTIMALGGVGLVCTVGIGLLDLLLADRRRRRHLATDTADQSPHEEVTTLTDDPEPPSKPGEEATAGPASSRTRRTGRTCNNPVPLQKTAKGRQGAEPASGPVDDVQSTEPAIEPPSGLSPAAARQ